ncbi:MULTISPECIES: ATP-binding protein [Clavibacter]|uniref:ATP-binding protein n=4 Tax=Clavibacter TaxID=1573 RepID=A0A2S5VDM9_9MICO|nr:MULTISPECIES: ATP-binding protein [Clavibacter]AJW80089.1 regulator [Clavibacter michiganensis subsp. insidiosus]AWF97256.1 ATP-binding protein [Clavibacter michiganensis subsp. insidiosus]AWG02657.1 ATP-binding protein [Clavibacter michiganensis subsp. insidiosus]KDP92147.1 regulator [Clavibacter cf. michiganensis LMG 26808]OQJ58916.1 ATP-binding protein [Clavibacter michiganensis subsp. insidiosus]
MTETTRSLTLQSPPDDVDAVHELVAGLWDDRPDVGALDRMAFETALIELASNVIEHADDGQGVTCVVSVTVDDGVMSARLRDGSEPGDFRLTTREMPGADAESGRGLAMVQMLCDELTYERVGGENVWSVRRTRIEPEAS